MRAAGAAQMVGRDEDLLGAELARAIEIDRAHRLVGRDRDDALDPDIEGGLDDVLGAEHVGVDAFERIVFGDRHLLHGGGMDDELDAAKRHGEAPLVAHVADEEAEAPVAVERRQLLAHLRLLHLVAREDDEAARPSAAQQGLGEGPPEGPGAARHEHRAAMEEAEERVGIAACACRGTQLLVHSGSVRSWTLAPAA